MSQKAKRKPMLSVFALGAVERVEPSTCVVHMVRSITALQRNIDRQGVHVEEEDDGRHKGPLHGFQGAIAN